MNKYTRSYPYIKPFNHYHRNSYYIRLDWKVVLVIALVVGLGLIGMWKIVNHDYCPLWYGIKCLPPYEISAAK